MSSPTIPRPAHTERGTALLALLAGALVIGVAPVLVRFADAGPVTVAFWRLLFSLPLLTVLARRSPGGVGRPSRLAVLAGLAFALDLAFWHNGIANTSVGKATVLGNLTPVVVTAMSWIFLKQRPARLFLLATGLSIGGAWTMAAARGLGSVGPNPLLGDALSLAAAFWYALYFMAISAARRVEGTARIMFWSALTGAPLLLVAGVLLGEQSYPTSAAGLGRVRRTRRDARGWSGGDRMGARSPAGRHRRRDCSGPTGGCGRYWVGSCSTKSSASGKAWVRWSRSPGWSWRNGPGVRIPRFSDCPPPGLAPEEPCKDLNDVST